MQRPIGNPETRRQSREENSMFDQIDSAVDLRLEAEEEFKRQIVSQLKALIMTLAECDPSNARTVLDLTQQQLGSIITKLNNTNAITSAEAANIVNTVRESNLLRRPSASPSDLPVPPLTVPSALPATQLQTPVLTSGRRPAPPAPQTPSQFPPPLPLVPQTHPLVKPRIGGRKTRRRRTR